MEYLLLFAVVLFGALYIYFVVAPYVTDYVEDVIIHFSRRRNSRK